MEDMSGVARNGPLSINASTNVDDSPTPISRPHATRPKTHRSDTILSEASEYDPFSSSIESTPGDIQELLKNLEKATALVKKHVTVDIDSDEKPKRYEILFRECVFAIVCLLCLIETCDHGSMEVTRNTHTHTSSRVHALIPQWLTHTHTHTHTSRRVHALIPQWLTHTHTHL